MSAGLLQLMAYGAEDMYLTGNPQMSYFKIVYRRHTNFAIESVQQIFDSSAKSNTKLLTATLSRKGDLIKSLELEVIILFKGILRVDFYNNKKKYLFSRKIYAGDIIMLVNGGHGFKVLKDIEMIEVKQGPYSLSADKIKFNKVDEKKIRVK